MGLLARRSLFHDKVRFVVTLTGIVLALVLIIVQFGLRAYLTAEAYGTHHFGGRVIRVGRDLGSNNDRTDVPSGRVDTKLFETLVELDPAERLPLGSSVESFMEVGAPESKRWRAASHEQAKPKQIGVIWADIESILYGQLPLYGH